MKQPTGNRSGGINVFGHGKINTVSGDVVGRDKVVTERVSDDVDEALRPVAEALSAAPEEKQAEATAKLDELKEEAKKGEERDDGVMAGLIEGIVNLVPDAVTAVVSAFGSPILSAITGPVTSYVLKKFQKK